jgi:hypothetical protein
VKTAREILDVAIAGGQIAQSFVDAGEAVGKELACVCIIAGFMRSTYAGEPLPPAVAQALEKDYDSIRDRAIAQLMTISQGRPT